MKNLDKPEPWKGAPVFWSLRELQDRRLFPPGSLTKGTGWLMAGFTLLELMAVITVVGVLAVVAVPAIGEARVAGSRGKCMGNQRQIGLALQLYAGDHNGEFPPTTHTTGTFKKDRSWVFELAPYLEEVDAVRVCPSDDPARQKRILDGGFTSYTLNDQVFDTYEFNNLLKIPRPSKTFLLGILSANRVPSSTRDHIHGAEWTSWAAALNDIEPDRHRPGPRAADRLKGSANYLYADGHVENRSAKDFKSLFDQGINPSAVPKD
jgi:prepilin-type N-terminal cleavage/methylation domain-containing protein/prepilin-type processing-associated H-X9-DG protein